MRSQEVQESERHGQHDAYDSEVMTGMLRTGDRFEEDAADFVEAIMKMPRTRMRTTMNENTQRSEHVEDAQHDTVGNSQRHLGLWNSISRCPHRRTTHGRQFLIIHPRPPKTTDRLQQYEHDFADVPIMQNRQDIQWPSANVLANAQKQLPAKVKKAADTIKVGGRNLYINTQKQVIIPDGAKDLQRALITLAHQDQHTHRSIDDTITRMREAFTFKNITEIATAYTQSCLQCLKIRGGTITPRPL